MSTAEERAKHAATQKARVKINAARIKEDPSLAPHGRFSTYSNWGCRCDECKATNTQVQRDARVSRKARLEEDPTLAAHGEESTYLNWGCRCDPCKADHAEKEKVRALERKKNE